MILRQCVDNMKRKTVKIKIKTPEEKMEDIAQKIFILAGQYWDEYHKKFPENDAVIWIKNFQTGQFICYTRSEYSEKIIETINNL